MIKSLNIRLRTRCGHGLFHDSRADVNTLGDALEKTIQKVNELVDAFNTLAEQAKVGAESTAKVVKISCQTCAHNGKGYGKNKIPCTECDGDGWEKRAQP